MTLTYPVIATGPFRDGKGYAKIDPTIWVESKSTASGMFWLAVACAAVLDEKTTLVGETCGQRTFQLPSFLDSA